MLAVPADRVLVAACGAHMEGLPLNYQFIERAGALILRTRTRAVYRLFALAGGPPRKPGMLRVSQGGAAIEVEVWSLPTASFGSLVNGIGAPISVGKVELEDGSRVSGFVCEAYATEGAREITSFGGWRAYLEAVDATSQKGS